MSNENRTYDEIQVGDEASMFRLVTRKDLILFAHVSGNLNPLHLPRDGRPPRHGQEAPRSQPDAQATKLAPVAPSMWMGALFSALFGNKLPGPGTLYLEQNLKFNRRAHVGDRLKASVKVIEKGPDRTVRLACRVEDQTGAVLAEGAALVQAPAEKQAAGEQEDRVLPDLVVAEHRHFDRLMRDCLDLPPLPTAIVCPEDDVSVGGAMLAASEALIEPIFIGAPDRIAAAAREAGVDIAGVPVISAENPDAAAARAVALVHEGGAGAIMKGHLHSDELLAHVTKREGGLRTNRRISHVFVMDVPGLDHLLYVSDAAINISPGLNEKMGIVQNAIDLAHALGNPEPRVGILSAVETVNPKIPSTIDAAVLSKMAERGQIKGGIVDGPLAMDNAMDVEAARTKGIVSLVAGHAEVLIAPNLESGNMLAKELAFVAHAEAAGLVVGARAPVMLTSRADNEKARLMSCALALLQWRRQETGATRQRVAAK